VQEEPFDSPEMSVVAANYAIRFCGLQDVAAKMVLTALAWQARKETPHLAHMSNEDIRRHTGLKSINGVKDALRRLVDAGEIRVREIGGRTYGIGRAADFELLGVKQYIESGQLSESDGLEHEEPSEFDGKVSAFDGKPSESDEKPSASDTHRQRLSKTKRQSADAPAPAISSPSLPSSPPKPARGKFDPCSIPLPHTSARFASTWADWVEHRRQIRKPLTEVAAKRLLAQLAKFTESAAIDKMDRAMAAGWQGCIFPQDLEELKKVVHMVPQRTRADDYYDALERRVGGIKA
jgi:hypothetical protein